MGELCWPSDRFLQQHGFPTSAELRLGWQESPLCLLEALLAHEGVILKLLGTCRRLVRLRRSALHMHGHKQSSG